MNCGADAPLEYCPRCGQRQQQPRLTVRQWIREVADELGWHSRVPQTFVTLFRSPGFLTQEFLDGRRARWVHPVRIYLFSSFALFAVVFLVGMLWPDLPETTAALYDPAQVSREEALSSAAAALAPQLLFLLVPVFAVLVMGLFRGAGHLYLEHMVFALHVHAVAFLLLFVAFPLDKAPKPWTFLGLVTIPAVLAYLILALRFVYRQSLLQAAIKGTGIFALHLTIVFIVLQSISNWRAQSPAERANSAYALYWKWTETGQQNDPKGRELLRRAALAHARLELHAVDAHTRYHYAKLLQAAGDREAARIALAEALVRDSTNLLVLGLAAELAAQQRDTLAAGGYRDRFIQLDSTTPPAQKTARFGGRHQQELTAYQLAALAAKRAPE